MKKIISGKVYDTETAQQVGEPWSADGFGPSDFDWCEETLYRKRTGEYFLHGEGGARTKYAEPYGQSGWTGGERIMPMEYDQARNWAEGHLTADEYIAAFGDPGEGDDDGLGRLQVKVPTRTLAAIDKEVSASGRTRSDVVADLLGKALGL